MPTVPLPSKRALADPGSTGVQLSLGANTQELDALQGLAHGIQGLSGKLSTVANKIARADNLQKVSENELDLAAAEAELNQTISSGELAFHPEDWLAEHDKAVIAAERKIATRKLSPEASVLMKGKLNEWKARGRIKISTKAAALKIELARESGMLSAELSLKNLDLPGYIEKVKALGPAGLASPAAIKRMVEEGEDKVNEEFLNQAVAADPVGSKTLIEESNLPGNVKRSLERRRRTLENQDHSNRYSEITLDRAKGKEYTREEIFQFEQEGLLSKGQASHLVSIIDSENPPETNWKAYSDTLAELSAYDPSQDPSKEQFNAIMADITINGAVEMSPKMVSRLRSFALQRVEGGSDRTVSSDAQRQAYSLFRVAHQEGVFGKDSDVAGTEQTSYQTMGTLMDAYDEWAASDAAKGATREQANQVVNDLIGKHFDKGSNASPFSYFQGGGFLPQAAKPEEMDKLVKAHKLDEDLKKANEVERNTKGGLPQVPSDGPDMTLFQ